MTLTVSLAAMSMGSLSPLIGDSHRHLGLDFGQRINGRAVEHGAVDREMRAVAGTVPAALERVPMQMATKVCARGRAQVKPAALVAIGRDLLEALPDDRTVAGAELVERRDLSGCDVLGEILHRSQVFADESAEPSDRLARRLVHGLPVAAPGGDKIRQKQASNGAVGHALA